MGLLLFLVKSLFCLAHFFQENGVDKEKKLRYLYYLNFHQHPQFTFGKLSFRKDEHFCFCFYQKTLVRVVFLKSHYLFYIKSSSDKLQNNFEAHLPNYYLLPSTNEINIMLRYPLFWQLQMKIRTWENTLKIIEKACFQS